MSTDTSASTFFVAGGNLHPKAPSYVQRAADDELFNQTLAGEFCYLLAAPQMGKSSLLVRTVSRLQAAGVRTAIVYLAGLDPNVRAEQWYQGLLLRLKFQLKLFVDLDAWWDERASLSPVQRFTDFMYEVVLVEVEGPVVIFFDEVETMLDLDFAKEFFAAIRSTFEARTTDPASQRLTFVLSGVATATDLIKEESQSPFSIGQRIDLAEFSRAEARLLQQGLQTACPEHGKVIFGRIFHWTNGHPYLTQKLCLAVVETGDGHWTEGRIEEQVDRLVEKLFLLTGASEAVHLQRLRDRLEHSPGQGRLLSLYRRVYQGKTVDVDEGSLDQNRLRIFGLVRAEQGTLKIRNEIYRRAFSLDRLKEKKSINWRVYLIAILVLLLFLSAGFFGFSIYRQRQQRIASQAQIFIDDFRNTTDPTVRLTSLAGLFDLPGYHDQARLLFYEELGPAEQLALFDLANPQAVGAELLAVVTGLYTAPDLENKTEDNALLRAMAQPLLALGEPLSLKAISLEIEIRQWLKGREHHTQATYQQALNTYNVAIDLNGRNPGLYFDRALAYAALGNTEQALTDFERVSSLDQSWQALVQRTVAEDSQLYTALWNQQNSYRTLAALVPTPTRAPTSTPVPTSAPAPATATATTSPTPVPLVATPTPSATPVLLATATPTASPTWTPTPASIRLAYVVTEEKNHTLFQADIINLAVADSEALVPNRASCPTWSPDGQRIAFLGEVGIEYELNNAPGGTGIWLYDLEAKAPLLLQEVGQVKYVTWSPEGSLIAYESAKDTGESRIFFMNTAGQDRPGNIRGEQPAWSPDSDRIMMRACRPECGLWAVDLAGGTPRQATFDSSDSFPHWGEAQIVFASQRAGNWDIYRLRVDQTGQPQGNPQQLTTDPSHDTTPVLSPDGQHIFFRSSRDGQWAIWVMNADGTNQRRLILTDGSDAWNQEKLSVATSLR